VRDAVLRIFGWRLLLIMGDPCVLDRWRWLRGRVRHGARRTFDAGSGNGAFSMFAASLGNEVVAASFQIREQEKARRRADVLGVTGVDFRVIDLRKLGDRGEELGTFDQVICMETIEHILDDEGVVSRLAAMLRPGGQLLLTTPFHGHRRLYAEEIDPSLVEDGGHVRYGYSPERLRQIVTAAGMSVNGLEYLSGVVSQKVTSLGTRVRFRLGSLPAWLLVLPLRPIVVLDAPLSRLLGYPHLSIALCAVKPAPPPA
jgi:2-polyprenyl-3-methyl-5-hydroxy-6-metoxy-1,4-benzoquinol methylase